MLVNWCHCGALTAAVLLAPVLEEAAAAEPRPTLAVMVSMRDGIKLATDVYLPRKGGPKWPVLLARTPYGRATAAARYAAATERGYGIVIQDMRGRFGSRGADLAFIESGWGEHADGVDTLRWVLEQEWCDGRIGTEGASALGITQCLLGAADPPGLAAQYIEVAAPSLYHHAAYVGGGLRAGLVFGWLSQAEFDPANLWLALLHPFYDGHWRELDSIARAERINVPAVHRGGWYDVFQQGTIDGFVSRQYEGGPGARGRQKLIIGPWGHGGPSDDGQLGELKSPRNSRKPRLSCEPDDWFDHYLRGKDTGVDRLPAVQYYTMGAIGERSAPGNEWRASDTWPVPSTATAFYFHADGVLSRDLPDHPDGLREYDYDPNMPVPTRGGCLLMQPAGPFDQRAIEQRPDVITFTSAPLVEPVEVTGRLTAELEIISDCVDTDFAVKLTDVYPDGRSMLIADGLARCRYRQGYDRQAPLTPGRVAMITVDLWSTSMIFNRQHRIRVSVSSSNYPRFDVNPNTGWPGWPMGPMRQAHNQVLCNRLHSSRIILPLVTR